MFEKFTKNQIIISIFCVISIIPVLILGIYTIPEKVAPDLYYSFDVLFNNVKNRGYALFPYGDLSFTDNGAVGKGIDMQEGYFTIEDTEDFKLSDSFTYAVWFKFDDLTAKEPILFARPSESGDNFNGPVSISISEDFNAFKTDITFVMKNKITASHSFYSGPLFTPSQLKRGWHHFAVVFEGNHLCYYWDGTPASVLKLPEEINGYKSIANNKKPFIIGIGKDSKNLNATIDELHFYPRALTEQDIKELYTLAKPALKKILILTAESKVILINGNTVEALTSPEIDKNSGEIMIPAKIVTEALGGTIKWDSEDRFGRADITLGNNTLSMWHYDTHAISNGNYYKLSCHPYTKDDVLLIPSSVLSDCLGADVHWDEKSMKLTISY